MPVIDKFGRRINRLRISITDRCNFNCSYCMPYNNTKWFPAEEILSYEEFVRLVNLFADLDINKVKITGGEPLMRRDLDTFVQKLSDVSRITDLSLTTNGYFLDKYAPLLEQAGLKRITVSLDSLKEERFNRIVRRSFFTKIYKNLMSLCKFSFDPVKVNVVIIRGFNDDEIHDFVRFAQNTGYIIRFIEFMPLDGDKNWAYERVVTLPELQETIKREFDIIKINNDGEPSPAERYRLADGSAEIGFIPTVSSPFCTQCGRIRLTADGQLRTCLFSHKETDLKKLLRSGVDDESIKTALRNALFNKEEGHLINTSQFLQPNRSMYQIGG